MTEAVMGGGVVSIPPVDPETPQQQEYFGFQKTEKFFFPDKVTFVELKVMNEGEKTAYQKLTRQDVVFERGSGNARMKADPSIERHALLETCIVGWNLIRNGNPLPFSKKTRDWNDFFVVSDPKLIEDIEKQCRKLNPWLLQDMSVEDIDREIENLQEMREVAVEREQGKTD